MSEGEYSEKKKSKVKSSRRAKKSAREGTDDSLSASTTSLATQQPLAYQQSATSSSQAQDFRESRLKELAVRKDLIEEQLQIEQQMADEEDSAITGSIPSSEARSLAERPYSGPAAMAGFRGLEKWARSLNLPVSSCPEPEIVFVGPAGEGKTSVLSALLGVQVAIQGGNSTKRPFVYHIVSRGDDDASDDVRIRRDSFLAEFGREVRLEGGLSDLPAEIERRNRPTEEPVDIDIALPGQIRMTLVDTPGFHLDPDAEGAALAEAALRAAIAPSNRLIVVVRRAVDVSATPCGDYLMDLVRQADPTLARTIAVYTHLSTYLQTAAATQDPKAAARFLSANTLVAGNAVAGSAGSATGASTAASGAAAPSASSSQNNTFSEGRIFFATFPNLGKSSGSEGAPSSEKILGPAAFAAQVYGCAARDLRGVEALPCDKQLIGAPNFARCVFGYVWRVHQASAPRILAALRARRAATAARLDAVREQRERLASPALFRVRAAAHTVEFLRHLRALVAGSACGNPALSGQTSAEERAACGGEWADAEGRPLSVRYGEWDVPNWQSKVYGGQQFERLLAEFTALCGHVTGDVISDDDVINAIGTPALGSNNGGYGGYRGRAEAACALACRRAEDAFAPLIAQLCVRATYVMKRLAGISVRMSLEEKCAKKKEGEKEEGCMDGRFINFVCERYAALIDEEASRCARMCADEFHSVEAVSFAMVEDAAGTEEGNGVADGVDEVEAVREMEKRAFERIRERVVRNVVLMFYGEFVVPMVEGEIWGKLQRCVSELEDEAVEGLFEGAKVRTELERKEGEIEKEIGSLEEEEKDVLKLAAAFCHPKN